MWVYTRVRNEHEHPVLLNLQLHTSITMSQLGDKWFLDAALGGNTSTLAQVNTEAEASRIMRFILESLRAGENAIDLNRVPAETNGHRK